MSDRIPLLLAIEANPDEDAPRLAYSDWLQEFGESDLDAATSEFIRVSCGKHLNKKRQSAEEGRWLQANWYRLVPSIANGWKRIARTHRGVYRSGRWINTTSRVYTSGNAFRLCPIHLEFWRGFVRRAVCDGAYDLEWIIHPLVADQPLIEPNVMFPPGLADETNRTVILKAEMGIAFGWLNACTWQPHNGHDPEEYGFALPDVVVITNDPLGKKAMRERAAGFRAYARSLSRLADYPAPNTHPEPLPAA